MKIGKWARLLLVAAPLMPVAIISGRRRVHNDLHHQLHHHLDQRRLLRSERGNQPDCSLLG